MNLKENFVQIIDGQRIAGSVTRHSTNPANLDPLSPVPVATPSELDHAVNSARKAFKSWSRVSYEERRDAVLTYADAVDELRQDFRDLLVAEQGKPVGLCIPFSYCEGIQ